MTIGKGLLLGTVTALGLVATTAAIITAYKNRQDDLCLDDDDDDDDANEDEEIKDDAHMGNEGPMIHATDIAKLLPGLTPEQ